MRDFTLSSLCLGSPGELALARPDGNVWAYVICGLGRGPGHFLLVLLKIFFTALRPPQREFHGLTRPLLIRGMLGAFVECHDDVRAQPDLCVHRALWGEKMK